MVNLIQEWLLKQSFVKEKYPDCMVIFGGPNVPLRYKGTVPLGWKENTTGNFFDDTSVDIPI